MYAKKRYTDLDVAYYMAMPFPEEIFTVRNVNTHTLTNASAD